MKDELAYALITPYSIYKSRTGGIIGRMLGMARLEFVAARMFIFSDTFLDAYVDALCPPDMDPDIAQAWRTYVNRSLRPNNPWKALPRCMLLLFRGRNAVSHLKDDVIGGFTEEPAGDTIRGTYGDFVRGADGRIHYFEPAVITCPRPELNNVHLRLLADYAISDGGVLTGRIRYDRPNVQVCLVMLKPDNFYQPSRRPGNIIDTFSLTGLRIVGAKLFAMTVAQGEDFYGPLKEIFVEKLKDELSAVVLGRLRNAFQFPFTAEDAARVADMLAERNAEAEFNKIIEYMTGVNPRIVSDSEKADARKSKCLALLYEGPDAIDKIRSALGVTDPARAAPGTVRSDFGRDLMRNGAHASDSPAAALRERRIVGLAESESDTCDFQQVIRACLAEQEGAR